MDQFGAHSMRSIIKLLKQSLQARLQKVIPKIPDFALEQVQVNSVPNLLPYDYQSPSALKLFHILKQKNVLENIASVEDLAKKIVEAQHEDNIIKQIEVGNEGYINITLKEQFIENEISNILKHGLTFPLHQKQKIVVDFSSPNIAKEMHVGHLRSTIIGESMCRILEFQGHEVVRVNHLGDWGTQFGMLINYLFKKYPDYKVNKPQLKELEDFYREAKAIFDSNEEFKKESQQYVVKLQALEPECVDAWKMVCDLSRQEFQKIYTRLGARIDEFGESYYNPILPEIVKQCEEKGIVIEDKGAKIIRIKGEKLPLMIVKSDGGYNYDTTDMAAARTRLVDWKADRVLYLTDVGQSGHFKLIFEGAKMMGWHQPPKTQLQHMPFGLVLGPEGKKFKTREGNAVKLIELLDEARDRALKQIQARAQQKSEGQEFNTGTQLDQNDYFAAAEKMGVAAIKYFDLKQNRLSDYKFLYDHMLDPNGNTAVYLMYSYVRILSVLRKSGVNIAEIKETVPFQCTHTHERHLAVQLLRLVDVLQSVTDQLTVNWLCDYIYEICVKISEAYAQYRILDEQHLKTRIQLCEAVRLVLAQCFYLVGIEPLERL